MAKHKPEDLITDPSMRQDIDNVYKMHFDKRKDLNMSGTQNSLGPVYEKAVKMQANQQDLVVIEENPARSQDQ